MNCTFIIDGTENAFCGSVVDDEVVDFTIIINDYSRETLFERLTVNRTVSLVQEKRGRITLPLFSYLDHPATNRYYYGSM